MRVAYFINDDKMSKRNNVSFTKPEEPSFIKKLKKEIGFKAEPTIETKRESLAELNDNEEERPENEPVVVVLNPGDLTPDEVAAEKVKQEQNEETKRADLDKRVIFRSKVNNKEEKCDKKKNKEEGKNKKEEKKLNSCKLLSFDQQDDEEEEDY